MTLRGPPSLFAVALVVAAPAVGKAAEPARVTSYPRAYFDSFAPSTAFDMVARVPGFAVDRGESRRGFGDTGGNVLINGSRPGSKAGGPREALSRIPASAVVRIDLITNPTSSEASGQSVVVDLIVRETGLSGSWGVSASLNTHGDVRPYMEAGVSGPILGWRGSGRAQFRAFQDNTEGVRRRSAPDGALRLHEDETRLSRGGELTLSGDIRREALGGEVVVNGRFEGQQARTRFDFPGYLGRPPSGQADQFRAIAYDADVLDAELGGEWSGRLPNAWSLKILSLGSWRHEETASGSRTETPPGALASEVLAGADRTFVEWVARATVTPVGARLRPEAGGEVAYNRLDSALSLASREGSGGLAPILLPAADVVVEERRAEAFYTLAYDLNPTLTLDAKAAAEWSEIAVSGDAENRQQLVFFKPALSLSWKPSPGVSVDAGLKRTVGQLDFDAFAASAEVGDDRTQGGNAELRPQLETRASLGVDLRGRDGLALNAGLFHEWRDDVLEPVILPGGGFGLGNAGRARVWGAEFGASVSLSSLASGLRLDARGSWRDAAFDDPLTGQSRRVTDLNPWEYDVELRQDLPAYRLSWSLQVEGRGETLDYFVPEVSALSVDPELRMSIESSHFRNLKLRMTVFHPMGRAFTSERTVYAPTRAGSVSARESRRWEEGRQFWFTAKGVF